MIIIVRGDKEHCSECGAEIYRAKLKLWDSGRGAWSWYPGEECLCGRFVTGKSGRRWLVGQYEDPETVENLRQITEEVGQPGGSLEMDQKLLEMWFESET